MSDCIYLWTFNTICCVKTFFLFTESEKSLESLKRVARNIDPVTSTDLETPEEIELRSYGSVLTYVSIL